MKGCFKDSLVLLLLPIHIMPFRDHQTIRRRTRFVQARTVFGESGGDLLDIPSSMVSRHGSDNRSNRNLAQTIQKTKRLLHDKSSMGGTTDDRVDAWLSNVFDRYDNLGNLSDLKMARDVSSSSKRKGKIGSGEKGSDRKHSDSQYDLDSDTVDSWLGSIYDHYDLPKKSHSPKPMLPTSKEVTSGKTNFDPVNDWLNNIFDHYGGGGGRPKKVKKKQSSKEKRTRQPQTIHPSFQISATPSPLVGTTSLPTVESFTPSNPTCDQQSEKRSSKIGTRKGELNSKGKSSICYSASPSPDEGSTVSPLPTSRPLSSSKNGNPAYKSAKKSQPSQSPSPSPKSKRSKRAPSTEIQSDPPVPTRTPSTRSPTNGINIITRVCSAYKSAKGNPSQIEYGQAADLTCQHIQYFVTETLTMGGPSVLLEDVGCISIEYVVDPIEICYEIAAVFDRQSPLVPSEEDVLDLVCLTLATPAVDELIEDLRSLSPSSPFSETTGLTCDEIQVPSAPVKAPSAPPLIPAPAPAPAPVPVPVPAPVPTSVVNPSTPVTPSAPVPAPRPAPVAIPSPVVTPTIPQSPNVAPSTTTNPPSPTDGSIVRSRVCSIYESTLGIPSQDDSNQAAGLTCAHLEEFILTTLTSPFILLNDVSCTEAATSTDPNRICSDITVVVAVDSEVVPTVDDVNTLVCIALLPPEVDALLVDLNALPASNPFSSTSALTCDIVAATAPTSSPSELPSTIPSTATPTAVPRRREEPAPTLVPTSPTEAPPNAPARPRTIGASIDASPFSVTYDATGDPGPRHVRKAGLLTCDHVVSVIRDFFVGSPYIILENAICNATATSNDPILIGFKMSLIFAQESVAVPTQSDVDSLIEITLSEPVVQELYTDLQGLPSSNPLSSTTSVTYQVLRRILVEQLSPGSFSSTRFSAWILGSAMLLFISLVFWD